MVLDGKGPLHVQVSRALRSAMLQGRFVAGSRLPPTRSLAAELGVSRNTVLMAYEQLRAEGFIESRVGSGSYVAAVPVHAKPRPLRVEAAGDPVSRYAARARQVYDRSRIPGRTVPGAKYSFQYGVPLTSAMLTTAWARELSKAARYTLPNYPMAQGLPALREAVCNYLARRRGIHAVADDVLIVAGTQQALALTARVLLDPGDRAVIEEPHYFAIRMGLQIHGAKVEAVATDQAGLRCDDMPANAPKLICVTPSHQFPGGAVMTLQRRLALLDYAKQHDSWIFEDDYDGEFRYGGRPLAALRALDDRGRVIYVGSFSKTIFPALRMGYMLVPAALRADYVAAKWADDFGSPAVEQAALAAFIENGGFERHLRRSARILQKRRSVLIEGLRACSKGRLEIADSHAGMHLVVWLVGRGPADCEALIAHAARHALSIYPIAPFYMAPPARGGLLMGYCGMSVAEIRNALAVLAQCLDELFPVSRARDQ